MGCGGRGEKDRARKKVLRIWSILRGFGGYIMNAYIRYAWFESMKILRLLTLYLDTISCTMILWPFLLLFRNGPWEVCSCINCRAGRYELPPLTLRAENNRHVSYLAGILYHDLITVLDAFLALKCRNAKICPYQLSPYVAVFCPPEGLYGWYE